MAVSTYILVSVGVLIFVGLVFGLTWIGTCHRYQGRWFCKDPFAKKQSLDFLTSTRQHCGPVKCCVKREKTLNGSVCVKYEKQPGCVKEDGIIGIRCGCC